MHSITPGAYQAPTVHSTYGEKKYGKEVLERVKHSGSLFLNGTVVNQEVKVDGSLQMRQATVQLLKMNGMCDVEGSTVKGLTTLSGMLKATQSFFQEIVISTDHLNLHTCTTGNITVTPCPNQTQQKINLINTRVQGSIQFENGQGIVEMDSLSRIDGQVSGGEAVKTEK